MKGPLSSQGSHDQEREQQNSPVLPFVGLSHSVRFACDPIPKDERFRAGKSRGPDEIERLIPARRADSTPQRAGASTPESARNAQPLPALVM